MSKSKFDIFEIKPDKKLTLFKAKLQCKYVADAMFKGKRKEYKSHSIK